MTEIRYRWIIGVLVGVFGVAIAVCALHFNAALAAKQAQIDLLKDDIGRLEKTLDQNIEKMLEQQTRIRELSPEPLPPPSSTITLRGTGSERDESQLEAVPFAGTGELVVTATAQRWADDTSIGLQKWDPRENGIVFRGGECRVVRDGEAVVSKPIPNWDRMKSGRHTYELSWNPTSLTFKVDGRRIATVTSRDLPPRSTTFLVRLNADYDDVLTVQSYRGRYTAPSGATVTVP